MIAKIKNIVSKFFKKPKLKAQVSLKLLHNLHEIKLDTFITCYCDADYRGLIVEGEPNEAELKANWDLILQKYSEAIGGIDLSARVRDFKNYSVLANKIKLAQAIIGLVHLEAIQDEIKTLFYNFGYNMPPKAKLTFIEALQHFESHLKKDIIEFQIISDKVAKTYKQDKSKKIDRDYFMSVIANIAEAFNVVLDEDKISVQKYCTFVNKYNKHIELLVKQNEKVKRK